MDIVLITRDRPELTEQTIRSMRANASDWSKHRLVVVFDGSGEESLKLFGLVSSARKAQSSLFQQRRVMTGKQLGVGGAKNFGAEWFRSQPLPLGRLGPEGVTPDIYNEPLLMFTDNDMYYLPGWDRALEAAIGGAINKERPITQLGGWRHPFHQMGSEVGQVLGAVWDEGAIIKQLGSVREVDAATGNCFVMRWADWLKYGPFDANAVGPGQSEDFALSQRIKQAGGIVATLDPPVAIHCGMVNCEGEPATGWREMEDMITRQLAAMPEAMRNDVLILRPAPDPSKLRQLGCGQSKQLQLQAFEDARAGLGMQPRQVDARDVIPGPIAPVGLRGVGDGTIFESRDGRPIGLNVGSGQRRFCSNPAVAWVNIDAQSVPPDRAPDVVCNVGVERLPFVDRSVQYVVLHQVLEHFGCGEAGAMLTECWRVLAPGGSLIVTVPDMRALAARWLGGELDTQLFMTNVYGAYMGAEEDRHKWGFDVNSLRTYLLATLPGSRPDYEYCAENYTEVEHNIGACQCRRVGPFDWREIPGALIARDWWVLAVEVVKP